VNKRNFYNLFGKDIRPVVHNNDLEETAPQALPVKTIEASFEAIWLVQMRYDNRNQRLLWVIIRADWLYRTLCHKSEYR